MTGFDLRTQRGRYWEVTYLIFGVCWGINVRTDPLVRTANLRKVRCDGLCIFIGWGDGGKGHEVHRG